jgi:alpha-glucosidase
MNEQGGHRQWWRDAVIYEVYVRSFADSDGDGIGDLPGIRNRLDHLSNLGVDAVWLTPFYPSPQADAGYDVADYRDVEPMFGSLADFDGLVTDLHERSMKIIVDIVPNHTSSLHPWFREALDAPPGSSARARYIFRDGRGAGGDEPPNDWASAFGGSAWTRVPDPDGRLGQWYLHLFAPEQPDLDWSNEEVRAEFDDVLGFWLDRQVDGFRIDVAHALVKDPALPDLADRWPAGDMARAGHPHWDREEVHEIYRRWRRIIDERPGDRVFCGEMWLDDPGRLARYLRPDELHTAFNFHFLRAPWQAQALRDAIDTTIDALVAVDATPTWVLSNHDVVRDVTRYGGGSVGSRRARAAALLMLALPGAAYIFQGEELGLPEVEDLPDAVRQDPSFWRTNGAQRGRDGCRVPLPWSGDAPPFGFSPQPASWLPQPADWAPLTAAAQAADPASMLTLYREALRLRKQLPALGDGALTWLETPAGVLAFRRAPGFACVVNLGVDPVPLSSLGAGDDVVLTSAGRLDRAPLLPADTTAWVRATS